MKDVNRVYKFVLAEANDLKADGSGNYAGSLRYGDATAFNGYSTWNATFMRYRVTHLEVYVMRASANTGAGTSPTQSVCYLDTAVTSSTPSGLSGAWSAQGARLYSDGGGYGFPSAPVKPIIQSKIVPEKEWFDLNSEKQLGCVAFYTTGNTVSVNAQTVFFKIHVEFSGLLI